MMINRTVTLAEIRALDPCYDPSRYAPEGWTGTLLDILDATHIPAADRIWVVTGLLDDRTNRLFAVWNSRDALSRVDNPDPRSVAVCDVAERYANGMATAEELAAAWSAARSAALAAAWSAAWSAALDAARDAARNAARSAAWDAAWSAAWDAAWDADLDADLDAAWDADWDAAWDAAWSAARDAQIAHLREMIAIPEVREG
jgi:hypothetical protein